MTRLELNILGCGSATMTPRHQPSCQVLNVRDNLMMIDCGEGAQLAVRRMKLKLMRLNHIFISHLHGDHCFGLPGLVSTMALLNRTNSLTIHTFKDGVELFSTWLDYFCRERPFEVKYNVIDTHKRVIWEDDALTVTTFPLVHRVPAVGFLFREKPKLRHIIGEEVKRLGVPHYAMNALRQGEDWVTPEGLVIPNGQLTTAAEPAISYAYCSDTKFSKRVIKSVEGVDWLYHEATYDDSLRVKAHKRYHSTALEAATVAREAAVGQLILGHFSKRYLDDTPLLLEAQSVFPATRLANEGMVIDLNQK
ncbi:MAG: ribonuclease Z [Muribaculaceae bacterium]|nr:ribonuclease Z [Muribaculaceae bacterium]